MAAEKRYDTPYFIPAPPWSPPSDVVLHPDSLTRLGEEEVRNIVADPAIAIGKAFATGWDVEKGEFKEVFKVYGVLKTERRVDVYTVKSDYGEEALAESMVFLGPALEKGTYIVPA